MAASPSAVTRLYALAMSAAQGGRGARPGGGRGMAASLRRTGHGLVPTKLSQQPITPPMPAVGLFGAPGSGKSTVFHALTRQRAEAQYAGLELKPHQAMVK